MRWKAFGHICVALGPLASIIFLLLALNPSPLAAWLYHVNYHTVHLSAAIAIWLVFGTKCALPVLTIAGLVVGRRRTRKLNWGSAKRLFHYAALAIAVVTAGVWLMKATEFDHNDSMERHRRIHTLADAQLISADAQSYRATHDGHWPPHLAALLGEGLPSKHLRYAYSDTPDLPATATAAAADQWSLIAGVVDSHCDYVYLGADLPPSPKASAEAVHIVVLYGKVDLPELPQILWVYSRNVYEYCLTARPVAFADGNVRFVPVKDLPLIFAEHNAARVRAGLPVQQIKP
jgi:hypothetical protein